MLKTGEIKDKQRHYLANRRADHRPPAKNKETRRQLGWDLAVKARAK